MRVFKRALLCLACLALVISTGFGMWVLISVGEEYPQLIGGITVAPVEIIGGVTVEIDEPKSYGYPEYSISVNYGRNSTDRFDIYKDVSFTPVVGFSVSNIPDGRDAYYYFTFESSSQFFETVEFDTTLSGQSFVNKLPLDVLDSAAVGQFQPTFRYKTGQKPQNVGEYKALIGFLPEAWGRLTLHVVVE